MCFVFVVVVFCVQVQPKRSQVCFHSFPCVCSVITIIGMVYVLWLSCLLDTFDQAGYVERLESCYIGFVAIQYGYIAQSCCIGVRLVVLFSSGYWAPAMQMI